MLTQHIQMKVELELLPCFINIVSIAEIEQGDSHQSFRVIDQNKAYFVKRLTNKQSYEQINLASEISRYLIITPTLVFTDQIWQVYEYINGQTLALATLSISEKIDYCIDVMVTCHQELSSLSIHSDSHLAKLNPKKIINELSVNLSDQQKLFITKTFEKIDQQLLISPSVCCHGDINFSNVIIAEQAWLIDFECACLADPEFDIAMMIAVNDLNHATTNDIVEQCINSYQIKQINKVKLSKTLVVKYLGFCYLINGLWYKSQERNTSDKLFANKAMKQFACFDQLSLNSESLLNKMR